MCIQPRRISAVSVAERVAAERGEPIGESVGYNIRLESAGGAHSSLVFCTNGVLLRMLTQGDGLQVCLSRILADLSKKMLTLEGKKLITRECADRMRTCCIKDSMTSRDQLANLLFSSIPSGNTLSF